MVDQKLGLNHLYLQLCNTKIRFILPNFKHINRMETLLHPDLPDELVAPTYMGIREFAVLVKMHH